MRGIIPCRQAGAEEVYPLVASFNDLFGSQ